MNIGDVLGAAAEQVGGYDDDDDDFDDEQPLSPLPNRPHQPAGDKQRDALSILQNSSEEVARMDRSSSKDAFEKAKKQVQMDVSIRTGDVESSLARISETVNSDSEELARAGVQSRHGDETVSHTNRRNDDMRAASDDDDDEEEEDDDDDKSVENSDPAVDRELFVATYRGNARKVDKLLNTGASHLARDAHGWTALHWAASEGHDDIMELLIDRARRTTSPSKFKKFLHCKDKLSGWTALHVAAVKGQKVCIKLLINAGAKISVKNLFGETPLQCANAESTDVKKAVVKLLTKQ
jgi:hypothetical protein